jgi:hypothetical protein
MMGLKYRTGEEIRRGDRILFHGNPAEIEAVASEAFCDPDDAATAWYVQAYQGGVMILDPMVSGRTFIRAGEISEYEDLEFVSRAETK